jgi:AAA+ superfamily predicted ATPase
MIEEDTSNSLILAATNHPEILDRALFRRFDDVIEYDLPNPQQIESILLARLGRFAPKGLSLRGMARETTNLSHADVTRAAEEAVKNAVMHDNEFIDTEELAQLLTRQPLKKKRARHKS